MAFFGRLIQDFVFRGMRKYDLIVPGSGNPLDPEEKFPIPPALLALVRDKAIQQAKQDRNSEAQMEYSMLAMLCERIMHSYGPVEEVLRHHKELKFLWL
jgi:hypothetical protein